MWRVEVQCYTLGVEKQFHVHPSRLYKLNPGLKRLLSFIFQEKHELTTFHFSTSKLVELCAIYSVSSRDKEEVR